MSHKMYTSQVNALPEINLYIVFDYNYTSNNVRAM